MLRAILAAVILLAAVIGAVCAIAANYLREDERRREW